MGSVYLAQRADDTFRKNVAVKVLEPGRSNHQMTRRFHQEREILAKLEHPNIARLLDGGATETGLPYLVMELVDGKPIDEYCDEHRLNISDRLTLFRAVCAAVSYAHQNLIVHRDLKHRNILVTTDGTVKLLDFGIAKLLAPLDEETARLTRTDLHPMTPDYASPEQIRGQPITTAADVYSLGVILFELLTGCRPYRATTPFLHEVARVICEEVPLRPSAAVVQNTHGGTEQAGAVREGKPARLKRRLAGDLDNIVLMALRKEPVRRYPSVEALSEDIRRHLGGLPVKAQRDTFGYRARKFIGRHRAGVVLAAAMMFTIAAAIASATWQAVVARQQRISAEEQAAEARAQRTRAEQKTEEADFHRRRAEVEATFAREQLRIAQRRTAEAHAQAREAENQRSKVLSIAKQTATITQAMLKLHTNNSDFMGADLSTRTVDALSGMLELHENDTLRESYAAAQDIASTYKSRTANLTRTTPAGWLFDSSNGRDFDHGLDNTVQGNSSTYIKSTQPEVEGSAHLSQRIDATQYRGKRIRVSGALKSNNIAVSAGLFIDAMGEDDPAGPLSHTSLQRPLRGTNPWKRYALVSDVPEQTTDIVFGITITGSGTVWGDDFAIEVVDNSIQLTRTTPHRPSDLNFEESGR